MTRAPVLPDGIVVVMKRSCPTCQLVAPILSELAHGPHPLTVYTQDDPEFPAGAVDDTSLEVSFALDIDTVPTILRIEGGEVSARAEGWRRDRWEAITDVPALGAALPDWRPGCGSRTQDADVQDARTVAQIEPTLRARRVDARARRGRSRGDVRARLE